MILRALALWIVLAGAALAQTGDDILVQPLDEPDIGVIDPFTGQPYVEPDIGIVDPFTGQPMEESTQEEERIEAETAEGAVLRALDKVSGVHRDLDLATGEETQFGRLRIMLVECRYPADNPEGDAFAQLVVFAQGQDDAVFSGWMIASSPALSAMDHRRYDVWVLRCRISPAEGNSEG